MHKHMSGWSRYFVGWSVHRLCLLVTSSSSCMVTVNDRAREACCHGNNWKGGTRGQSETLCTVDCISLAKKSSKPHVHSSKPLTLRMAMNNFTDIAILKATGFELCTCGFELYFLQDFKPDIHYMCSRNFLWCLFLKQVSHNRMALYLGKNFSET